MRPVAPTTRTWPSAHRAYGRQTLFGDAMTEEITCLPEPVSSIVNKPVENEGASFPFLVAAVGLNGAI